MREYRETGNERGGGDKGRGEAGDLFIALFIISDIDLILVFVLLNFVIY